MKHVPRIYTHDVGADGDGDVFLLAERVENQPISQALCFVRWGGIRYPAKNYDVLC
jgi:hypothetical protein